MKRKMLALAVLLGTTVFASSVPPAEATFTAECGALYCQGKYSNTKCYCSERTERPGWAATCGSWKIACY
jgi:hypothetical protein